MEAVFIQCTSEEKELLNNLCLTLHKPQRKAIFDALKLYADVYNIKQNVNVTHNEDYVTIAKMLLERV